MKVAIDCRMRFGVGTVVREVAPLLARQLDELTLLGDPSVVREWAPFPASTRVVPFTEPVYGWREQFHFPVHSLARCDLLHVPHINVPLRRLPCPLVVTINDVAHLAGVLPISVLYRAAAGFYYGQAASRARHIITLSDFSRREIIQRLNVPGEKITVVPCGVDPGEFFPRPAEQFEQLSGRLAISQPYIVVLGSVRPHKNVGRVIEAFVRLKREMQIPHRLVIVGQREGFKISEDLPSIPGEIAGSLLFTGYVSQNDVAVLYSFAELLIFASIYEGFGLPPLEAMACGAPVAVSRAASLPEVVGEAGAYFDPFSAGDIARVVGGLLSDAGRRKALAAAGRERARAFSWEETARRYAEVYLKCL